MFNTEHERGREKGSTHMTWERVWLLSVVSAVSVASAMSNFFGAILIFVSLWGSLLVFLFLFKHFAFHRVRFPVCDAQLDRKEGEGEGEGRRFRYCHQHHY